MRPSIALASAALAPCRAPARAPDPADPALADQVRRGRAVVHVDLQALAGRRGGRAAKRRVRDAAVVQRPDQLLDDVNLAGCRLDVELVFRAVVARAREVDCARAVAVAVEPLSQRLLRAVHGGAALPHLAADREAVGAVAGRRAAPRCFSRSVRSCRRPSARRPLVPC